MRTIRAYGLYDAKAVSRETAFDNGVEKFPSKTVQSEKDNADINVIVRRFGVTGVMPGAARLPEYGDYEGISDFQSAMNAVRLAQESFMEMSSELRRKFRNDPQEFLEYCSNPDNLDELRKMGLAKPKEDDIITATPAVPEVKEKSGERSVKKRTGVRDEAVGKSDEGIAGDE